MQWLVNWKGDSERPGIDNRNVRRFVFGKLPDFEEHRTAFLIKKMFKEIVANNIS